VAARLADCGIGLYESPNVIVPSVLAWLGEAPNSEDPGNLQRAQNALMAVRPYIRKISSGSLVEDLATGDLCVIIASNGDAMQAQERVRIARNGKDIRYSIPREGAVMWFDVMAIPTDAPSSNQRPPVYQLPDGSGGGRRQTAMPFIFPMATRNRRNAVAPELQNAAIFSGRGSGRAAHPGAAEKRAICPLADPDVDPLQNGSVVVCLA